MTERVLPTVEINGVLLSVDVDSGMVSLTGDPCPHTCLWEVPETDGKYAIHYNTKTNKLAYPWENGEEVIVLRLPQFVELDPEGMSRKYNIPMDRIKGMTDFDVIVDKQVLAERLRGVLPTIEIMGQDYIVDLENDLLKPVDRIDVPAISLAYMEPYEEDLGNEIPYNPRVRCLVDVDLTTLTRIPTDFRIVRLPFESEMDCIGFNKKYGRDLYHGIKRCPPKRHHQAKVLDWEHTAIAPIVELNKRLKMHKGRKKGMK